MKKRKRKQPRRNFTGRLATTHTKRYKHGSKETWKHTQLYNRTPPRNKPAPDNLTYINRDAYLQLCRELRS